MCSVIQGYVIVDKFFDKTTELDPCRTAIEKQVDNLANMLFAGGKIKSKTFRKTRSNQRTQTP